MIGILQKTKSSEASQCLTTVVHQLIHLVLAAAVRHTCCRLFLPFAIKRTQYQVPVWLLSLLWFKKEKEQRACNQIPNNLIWQRWAIALKAKSTELAWGNQNPAKCSGGAFTEDIDVHNGDKDRLDTCCSVPPYCLSIVWSKRSSRRWVLLCPGFKAAAGVSTAQGLWLGEVFTWCTLAQVTLPCWQIYAVSTKFHQGFLQSLAPHSQVLLRAEEKPQIHW